MSTLHLERLFSPRSVALIGASDRVGTIGHTGWQNLNGGTYAGAVYAVNPRLEVLDGQPCYPDVTALPQVPDLALIATPRPAVAGLVEQLGRCGTRAASILTAGFDEPGLRQALLDAARPHGVRLLGPNSIGFLNPRMGLNASFAHLHATVGKLALVAQSGALCTAILDWAGPHGIGFTHLISLGDTLDVDFGDVLDHLGGEGATRGILLYVEAISSARKFMSAARSVARNVPIIAIKAGRQRLGRQAARSHTGVLAGNYAVYESAFRRAGILMVDSIEELFDSAATVTQVRPPAGRRLAIVTNGGGPGVIAVDALTLAEGDLATLHPDTIAKLDASLPSTWSRSNPIDIVGDADAERYRQALGAVAADPGVDAILVLNVPTALMRGVEAAQAIVDLAPTLRVPLLTNWLGDSTARHARALLAHAGIPTYETPHMAIGAWMTLVHRRQSQTLLAQTPPSLPEGDTRDLATARRIITEVLGANRTMLSELEAKSVLAACGIPVVQTCHARDVDAALSIAAALGYPLAVKILSPDITHKSDVGGVVLDVESDAELREAIGLIASRVARRRPGARIEGYALQPMVRRPQARELILGISIDPIFGPVILFGDGGTAVEVLADLAIALPPLNLHLARDLIARTRVFRLLRGYRGRPAADLDALTLTLVRLSELIIALPQICELDINPLLADAQGVIALDARIGVQILRDADGAPAAPDGTAIPSPDRLAIRPYPSELEEWLTLSDGERLLLRPIRPEDEPAHLRFWQTLRPEDVYYRFFTHVRDVTHEHLARSTQIDYDREMAFIAIYHGPDGDPETVGVARTISDADNRQAEFAIILSPAWQGRGLGHALMDKLIRYTRQRGTERLVGQILTRNRAMLDLARDCGFAVAAIPDDPQISSASLQCGKCAR